ncbi:MAG: glycogen phosphorylase, partial [Lachnospiraceae bacterium]|nr:glycogen phosphorylase [Lachnospiraceae bacterium]
MIAKQHEQLDKEMFKRSVEYNIKTLFRITMKEASELQLYTAAAYALKDAVIDHWMKTQRASMEQDPKTVYYMSMEFLMGRFFGNDLINMQAYQAVKKALKEIGID